MDPSFPPTEHDPRRQPWHSASMSAPFRLDEGFSEDTSSQDENGRFNFERLQGWIMAQSEEDRAEIAYEILRTMRTSNVAAVVDKLTPLLHMDPLQKLPPEITAEIFANLDAATLLTASLASHTWRGRIMDSRLWQELYIRQGWGVDLKEIKAFEDAHANLVRQEFKKARGQFRELDTVSGQPQLKKRATSDWLDSRPRQISADISQWREQHGTIEADTDVQSDSGDQEMRDAPPSTQNSPQRPNKRHSQESGDEMDIYSHPSAAPVGEGGNNGSANSQNHHFKSTLTWHDLAGDERLDWSYLYKQRRRLEDNWTHGRFSNFQLPHPAHPQEAHTECVYTIQFYGKWLVSGSRDKTLRIWDLETRRLRGKPLTGHSQSVLCLQFDPSEGEDVIISGSSDSSIIVWKFSTGQKMHEIPSAHEESVLNLRFDKRYLVTCSKDRRIKVWSRRQMTPLDPDYPKINREAGGTAPAYIVDVTQMEPLQMEAGLANSAIKPLKPYTHLLTLPGHSAAVNAIQIHGDLVVSASGDRLIKVWNVKDGRLLRTLPGHSKGIACVQFDSKRIVSGSSDNTVRIYDPYSGAEVAELKGHANLVRTVQAGFGDTPGLDEDLDAQARAAERKYFEDMASGRIVDDRRHSRRLRNGEIGSSRVAFGAKLPPGGGGSKWGRIVSGSYDESIIIWRKNAHGDWVIGQTLRQESAIRASSEPPRIAASQLTQEPQQIQQTHAVNSSLQSSSAAVGGPSNLPMMSASQIVQQAMGTSFASLGAGISNVVGIARNLNGPIAAWSVPPRSSSGQASTSGSASVGPPLTATTLNHLAAHTQNVMSNAVQQALVQPRPSSSPAPFAQSNSQNQSSMAQSQSQTSQPEQQLQQNTSQPPSQTQQQASVPIIQQQQQPTTQPQPPQTQIQPQQQQQQPPPQQTQSVSRVFKLQFDARRIVCCSQDSRIIGWDFANGDPDIIESCRFFIGP